jgi:hypothetical protein
VLEEPHDTPSSLESASGSDCEDHVEPDVTDSASATTPLLSTPPAVQSVDPAAHDTTL